MQKLNLQHSRCKIIILPMGNLLGLIFKNYYEFVFMWILWLRNLFLNLTTNYGWNNYVSSKVIKLRKFVTEATNIETRIQKYRYEVRDGISALVPLHADNDNRGRWRKLWSSTPAYKTFDGCFKLFIFHQGPHCRVEKPI